MIYTHVVDVLVEGQTGQMWRSTRERAENARRRQVLPVRRLPREGQALEVAANIPQRARGVELLLRRVEAHVEPERDGLRHRLPAVEALEDVRRDAEVGAAHELAPAAAAATETHILPARVPVVLERDELRLRGEPPRERLAPREEAGEALQLERTVVQYLHVVVVHRPRALPTTTTLPLALAAAAAAALPGRGCVDGFGYGQVLEVDEQLHHPRHDLCVPGFGRPVHRARERQALDAASQIRPREHGAAKVEKPLFGDGDIFIKLGLHVDPERTGDEREAVVKVGGADELQYGPEKLEGHTWREPERACTCTA